MDDARLRLMSCFLASDTRIASDDSRVRSSFPHQYILTSWLTGVLLFVSLLTGSS